MTETPEYIRYKEALWCFFVFLVIIMPLPVFPQKISNAQVRSVLVRTYLEKGNICPSIIIGTFATEIYTPTCTDSLTQFTLLTPEIQYRKVGTKQYIRTISQPIALKTKDSLHAEVLFYQDSITQKELKSILKEFTYPPLKGENPLPSSKYIKPALWAAGSVFIVFALFYFRG